MNAWSMKPLTFAEQTKVEEGVQAKQNNIFKTHFPATEFSTSQGMSGTNYPALSNRTLTLPLPFAALCFCKINFSTLVKILMKTRNKFKISEDFRQSFVVTILLLSNAFNSGSTKVPTEAIYLKSITCDLLSFITNLLQRVSQKNPVNFVVFDQSLNYLIEKYHFHISPNLNGYVVK